MTQAGATPAVQSSYLTIGSLFAGRYEILRELGRGGVSVVYAARDRQVGQNVALKLLVPSPATANQTRERMRREVNAVRRLVHPNIVAAYDFVEEGPYGAVIMELVDGDDLDRRIRRSGPLPTEEVARVATDVASALAAAHRHGVLHRDVKPQNILLDRDGRARLTDFGSARMEGDATITRTGAIVGTLAYMAPEVIAGQRADARSDVFSLGMTLFYTVAGQLPDRPSPHLPLPPSATGYWPDALGVDVPEWLARVIARATSGDPSDRHPTPTALADAIARRDAQSDASLMVVGRERCVLCGALDVLGAGVCPACTSGSDRADGFVFLDRARSASERDSTLDATAALLGAHVTAEMLTDVTTGRRPLMRVPFESRERVVEVLAVRRLRARVFRERELWRALPPSFLMMTAVVVSAGLVAGSVGGSGLAAVSIPFAILLVAGATISLRTPAVTVDVHASALSDGARRRIADTFVAIPAGPARSLLTDVVRRGHAVRRALALRQDVTGAGATVEELLVAACASARDLAALDDSLAQFGRERARDDRDARWLDSLADCERTRDASVQRLLDAVTVLGQLDAETIRGTDDVDARLTELISEIDGEVRARSAARDEMTTLLAR